MGKSLAIGSTEHLCVSVCICVCVCVRMHVCMHACAGSRPFSAVLSLEDGFLEIISAQCKERGIDMSSVLFYSV